MEWEWSEDEEIDKIELGKIATPWMRNRTGIEIVWEDSMKECTMKEVAMKTIETQ